MHQVRKNYVFLLVWITVLFSVFLLTFFGTEFLGYLNQVDPATKSSVMGAISGGTLALGALSLTVLSYSFSEMHSRTTTETKAPYRRLALIAFLIIMLSLTDSFVSMIFLLTKGPFSFEVSLTLLFLIVIGLVLMVSLWIIAELVPGQKRDQAKPLIPL